MTKQTSNCKHEQTLVFLHIPKTAGTTLSQIIERQYHPRAIVNICNSEQNLEQIDRLKSLSSSQQKKIKFIEGHTFLGWDELLPQPCAYFTLLRNPIERFISNYYYILKNPNHSLHQSLREQQITLKDFASCSGEDNYQTRCLARTIGEKDLNINEAECNREMLDRAKRNLRENCAVVGIVEEFDRTLLLLKKTFGWNNVFYKVKNKNKQRPSKNAISQVTLSLIEEKNKLDLELYQYATEIFHSLVKNQDNSFEKEVENFQNINYSSFGQFSALMSSSASKVQKIITLN